MADYDTIDLDVSPSGLAVILLNRPDKRNAINAHVIEELRDALGAIARTPEIRCVLLRGAGDAFSAGADIEWMRAAASYTTHENEEDAFAMAEMLRSLYELPQATIAVAHGAAMGGGAGLVAACDIAIARRDTKFAFSEVRLGIIPATISPYVVSAIGPRWSRALFATGEVFGADFAREIGLVQKVAADENELEAMVEQATSHIFAGSPAAIADAKDLVLTVRDEVVDASLGRITARRLAHRRASDQGREGLAAFLERRKPNWTV